MDLRHFRTFVVLAQELHFGRAANRLHTSQPVVSRTVREMEQELGTKLFIRTARRTQLSPAGEAFLPSARKVMDHADRAARAARAGTFSGIDSLRLGLLIGAAQPEVGRMVRAFLDANPLARISLCDVDEQTFADALVSGRIDAAIAWDASIPPGLHSQHLSVIPMSVLLPTDHPLASHNSLRLSDLEHETIVLPLREKQPIITERYRSMCRDEGFLPRVNLEVATTADLLAMVSGGAGISIAPVPVGMIYPGIRTIAFEPPFKLSYHLVWSNMTPKIGALLEAAGS